MTRRLYEEDAHIRSFTARVTRCVPEGTAWLVTLDATAFFPEGGGQTGDTGTLDGITVTDTQMVSGDILHRCSAPLEEGRDVRGELDWEQRFSRMQQHTGEHIISGLVHALTGFDNVGFHMGADCTTVDFSGPLTREQTAEVAAMANRIVWENRPIRAWYPAPETLSGLPYRSKKAIDGPLRLVEIQGVDLCACCAPHVAYTGEIGPIVILGQERLHGGTRLQLLCGGAAMGYLTAVQQQNREISALLSAKPLETAAAVTRLQEELGEKKQQMAQNARFLQKILAERYRDAGDVMLFLESGDAGKTAEAVAAACGGVCRVFVPQGDGFRYAMAQVGGELSAACRELHAALGGKGGGRGGLVQGSLPAARREIEAYFGRES